MSDLSDYPLVSFALLAFNQENYVREAVEGALAQDYPNLELIISDDCSSDGTWSVILDVVTGYVGPHHLVLNQNEKNLGIGSHVNLVASLAKGALIVLAAGDDFSQSGRTSELHEIWNRSGCGPACIYSDVEPVDENGNLVVDWCEAIYPGPHSIRRFANGIIRILGAPTAYTRDVFSSFSPMSSSVVHEDRVLPLRALLLGGKILFVDEKLIRYRVAGGISRSIQGNRKAYLQAVSKIEYRLLSDAVQRLSDVFNDKMQDCNIVQSCVRKITDHLAHVRMASSKPSKYEIELIYGLRSGASIWPAVRLYLKLRFIGVN